MGTRASLSPQVRRWGVIPRLGALVAARGWVGGILDRMRPTPERAVCRFGHVATTGQLAAAGESARMLAAGIRLGTIQRAAQGVYVCRHADDDQRIAARAHARIDCVSALRRADVWAGMDRNLHLRVDPHAARIERPPNVRVHWCTSPHIHNNSWIVAPEESLRSALGCLDAEHAIAALESAVHRRFITRDQLRRVCSWAPGRLTRDLAELELTAQSGLETIVRLRLRRAGFRVVTQGFIPGVGHQDLVVEDVVGIETDGSIWHAPIAQHKRDLDRDVRSTALGRNVLRLGHDDVLIHWETSLSAIARAVADARDLRRYRGR